MEHDSPFEISGGDFTLDSQKRQMSRVISFMLFSIKKETRSQASASPRFVFVLSVYFPSVSALSAVMRWAMRIGMAVIKTTSRAVTFVMGRLRGLSIWL